MEQEHNSYIGDVVNGLAKEAAHYKHKCSVLEAENIALKQRLSSNETANPEEYINKEHFASK
jgi:cell shape-determining protein MreC